MHSTIASFLRSHWSINYIFTSFPRLPALAVKFTTGVNLSSLDFSLGRQRTRMWAIVEHVERSWAIVAPSSEDLGMENEINQDCKALYSLANIVVSEGFFQYSYYLIILLSTRHLAVCALRSCLIKTIRTGYKFWKWNKCDDNEKLILRCYFILFIIILPQPLLLSCREPSPAAVQISDQLYQIPMSFICRWDETRIFHCSCQFCFTVLFSVILHPFSLAPFHQMNIFAVILQSFNMVQVMSTNNDSVEKTNVAISFIYFYSAIPFVLRIL